MKKLFKTIIITLLIAICLLPIAFAQTLSPKVLSTSGGYATGTGVSLSWTLGETFTQTLSVGSTKLSQGQQQPEIDLRTGSISTPLCLPSTINVPFTASGYVDNGNIFTAQISDASGSFSSPVNIGTSASVLSGNISATIPINTSVGTGYRIRVVSSNPVYVGKNNGTNITIGTTPTISATTQNVACKGTNSGAINLSASGTPTLSYFWNNGSTNEDLSSLYSGYYSVTVTNGSGCTKTASYQVTQPVSLLTISISKTNVRCGGKSTGEATASPTGGAVSYSYLWNNGNTNATILNLIAATYTVTVTDVGGCSKTKTVAITQNPVIIAIASRLTATTATVSVTGGVPGYTYSWNTSPIQTTLIATGLTTTSNYKVKVTDSKGCTKTDIAYSLRLLNTGITCCDFDVSVFPNPTNGIVNLAFTQATFENFGVKIFNSIGEKILDENRNATQLQFDLTLNSKGIYLFEIKVGEKSKMIKVVLE